MRNVVEEELRRAARSGWRPEWDVPALPIIQGSGCASVDARMPTFEAVMHFVKRALIQ
jgi:hypothetical protein